MRVLRHDVDDSLLGSIITHGVRQVVEAAVLHWGVGEAPLEATPRERVVDLARVNRPRRTGYSTAIGGGVVYPLANWRNIVWHAGGPRATIDNPNTTTFGVCIAYIGPSEHPRGIAGEQLGPHHKLGQAWYPPIDRLDVLLAAQEMRRLRRHGLKKIYGHAEINAYPDGRPAKSDPHPVDMGEFRRLVFDDDYWEAQVAGRSHD